MRLCVVLLLLLAWSTSVDARAHKPSGNGSAATNDERPRYNKRDILISFATYNKNLPLIEASRPWRRGVRTHIVVDPSVDVSTLEVLGAPHLETFSIISNFPGFPSNLRPVLAPVFALEHARRTGQPFKWLLLGDDDTIFVVPAMLRLLNSLGLSAEDPIALSDFLNICPECDHPRYTHKCRACVAPSLVDPRCKPCPKGTSVCPCVLLRSTKHCPHHIDVSYYGGAGVVLSAGMLELMANISNFSYFSHVFRKPRPCSDVVISDALCRLGYGFTSTAVLAPPPPPLAAQYLPPEPPELPPGISAPPAVGVPGLDGRPAPPNFFSTFCRHADQRSLKDLLADLTLIQQRDPNDFQRMVTVHARTATNRDGRGEDLDGSFLEHYRQLVDLLRQEPGPDYPYG